MTRGCIIICFTLLMSAAHSQAPSFQLTSAISYTTPIAKNNYEVIIVTVKNLGASTTVDFECDLDNTNGSFNQVIAKICSQTFAAGASKTLTFNSSSSTDYNPISAAPGNYIVNLIVSSISSPNCPACGTKVSSCISNVQAGSYSNPVNLTVTGSCTPTSPSTCTASMGSPANGTQHHISLSCSTVAGVDGYSFESSSDASNWSILGSGTLTNYDVNTGDNPNTAYYYRVRTYCGSTYSSYKTASAYPIYTACDVPATPTVNGATSSSLKIALNAETPVANPGITTYAIYCTTTSKYVQSNGSLGSSALYQSKSAWGTTTVSGLSANTNYCFYALAQNSQNDIRSNSSNSACGTTAAGPGCSYSISPTSSSVSSSSGSGSITVSASAGCSWTAVSNNISWLTITAGNSSTGTGNVNYSYTANGSAARSGTITVAGTTFTITQAGAGCTYGISPTSASPTFSAGSGAVSVTADAGCNWTAVSNNTSWLTITAGSSGTGNGSVNYSYTANGTASRTGTITIAGYTFTITQAGASCTYGISPASVSPTSSAGSGSISVTADAGCSWTAVSNNTSWLTITAGSNGTGNGSVSYSYTSNGTTVRTGTIIVAGYTFTVNQSGTAPQPTISIASSVIPPWQRQGDAFSGSITVDLSHAGSSPSWHIEADAFDANNIYQGPINIGQGTTTTSISFTSSQVSTYIHAGWHFNWNAVLESNSNFATATLQTSIIESKWDNKNVVYFNQTGNDFKIPLRYDPNATSISIYFSRDNSVSDVGSLDNLVTGTPSSIYLNGNSNPYVVLQNNSVLQTTVSNIKNVSPGIFSYLVVYNNGNNTPPETGTFDLVKIGRILNGNPNSSHVVVFVAGLKNTLENDIISLDGNSQNPDSKQSFSLASYIRFNSGYDTWYIAQSNENSVVSNAYNLGIALDSIEALCHANFNSASAEIDLVGHSKGGLEIRALLGSNSSTAGFLTQSLSGGSYNFSSSLISPYVKKVVFLDVPHWGAKGAVPYSVFNYSPAVFDLYPTSVIIQYLNSGQVSIPSSVADCLNLSGFYSADVLQDGAVQLTESENPKINHSYIQFYQNDPRFWSSYPLINYTADFSSLLHTHIHRNYILSSQGECTQLNPNLNKILDFIQGYSTGTCMRNGTTFQISLKGSILSGAGVMAKGYADTGFHNVGISDENGNIIADLFNAFSINDSLKIDCPGYETLLLAVDSAVISSGKIEVSMLRSTTPTSKIQHPAISLINHSPITSDSTINLNVTSQNAISYQVNNPISQDTAFALLNLNNNSFITSLNVGYNRIVVRMIGLQDTVALSKEIYYWPDTLMNQNCFTVYINADSSSFGTNLYLNNQFVKQVYKVHDSINAQKGINTLKFTKSGYTDSLITIDSSTTINLSLQLFPHSYSSLTDSSIINFQAQGKVQYRKSVTVMDSTMGDIISMKQYDDNFQGKGLIPKSRKFEFRRLTANSSGIRFTAALDQIENLSRDSIYLLNIYNDSSFTKIAFDSSGVVAEYDSMVQKLAYNFIDFNRGAASKEALVIMKKQAPVVKNITAVSVNENDTLKIALSSLFADPDSLHNDMSFRVTSSSAQLNTQIVGDSVILMPINCWNGAASFTLQAQHDSLWRSNSVSLNVIPAPNPVINSIGPTSFCQGASVRLTSSAGKSYLWSNTLTTQSINVSQNGSYSVTVTDFHNCNRVSQPVTITVLPLPQVNAGPSKSMCYGDTVSIGSNPVSGSIYSWIPATGLSNAAISNPLASPPATLNYKLKVSGTNGCTDSAVLSIIVNPLPIVAAVTNASVCYQSSITIGSSPLEGNSYTWTPATALNSTNISNPIASPLSDIIYTLKVTNSYGCSATGKTFVKVNSLPIVSGGYNAAIKSGSSVEIGGTPTASGNSPFTYSWTPANSLNSGVLSNPSASPLKTTLYTVAAIDKNGCTDSSSVSVYVIPKGDKFIAYPNPTTSLTTVIGANVENGNWNISIVNPSGKRIRTYKTEAINNTLLYQFSMSDLPTATYFIVFENNDSRNTVKVIKGN